jgi:hypothetical protein
MNTVIVGGVVANKYLQGGAVWTRLNWVLGLRKLGLDVHLVEQIDRRTCVDARGRRVDFQDSVNLAYFRRVVGQFGLADRSTLLFEEGEQSSGLSLADLIALAGDADLLINIAGHLTLERLLARARRRVYIDLDPGYVQMWQADGVLGQRLHDHDLHFSVGENIGRPECTIPPGDIRWRPVRQPVVLDEWPVSEHGTPDRFTSVARWRGPYGPVDHSGRVYGSKVHEFRKFIGLPRRAQQSFELALDIHPDEAADLALLTGNGWRLVDPTTVAGHPETFRNYVQDSGAEFSVAQGVYVHTGSGWFSDRTVRYLASGKPALVQDTGFSRNYPVGDGLLAFRTLDEAVRGAEQICSDYALHAKAARDLAETYFDSDKVLSGLLEEIDSTR